MKMGTVIGLMMNIRYAATAIMDIMKMDLKQININFKGKERG